MRVEMCAPGGSAAVGYAGEEEGEGDCGHVSGEEKRGGERDGQVEGALREKRG